MRKLLGIIAALALVLGLAVPVMAAGSVSPPVVTDNLTPGASINVAKAVQTPVIPPKPDVYFLVDNTGSMGPAIANVQANAQSILDAVLTAQSDAQFGVGNFLDFPYDPYCFQNQQPITNNTTAVKDAINNWTAASGAGHDGPEGWFYALTRLADSEAAWRTGSTRIVVIVSDAPSHDPIPQAATGLSYDITEATVTAALQASKIRVIAVNLNTGDFPVGGMDADPTGRGGDYTAAYGIVEDGSANQASNIAAATGGADLITPSADQVSTQILAGLSNLPITVSWTVVSDTGLTVSLTPASVTVTSGQVANFNETITVANNATQGATLTAVVTFVDENKNVIATENISIYVKDVTPPQVTSIENVNPSGKKIPPAGSTTLPGAKGGMNEDGFYQLLAKDNVDPNPSIYVSDNTGSVTFGPFFSGIVVKFTEDSTVPPEMKSMGGPTSAVSWHIILPSDAVVTAVDASGNRASEIQYVPPPPK